MRLGDIKSGDTIDAGNINEVLYTDKEKYYSSYGTNLTPNINTGDKNLILLVREASTNL